VPFIDNQPVLDLIEKKPFGLLVLLDEVSERALMKTRVCYRRLHQLLNKTPRNSFFTRLHSFCSCFIKKCASLRSAQEVRLPQGNDQKWHSKCDSNHASHPCWLSDKSKMVHMEKASFTVRHYAGDVEYSSKGFYDKNKDALFRDLYDLMSTR